MRDQIVQRKIVEKMENVTVMDSAQVIKSVIVMMAIMDRIVKMTIVGLNNKNVLEMGFAIMDIVNVIQDIVKWIAHLEIVVTMINAMIMVSVRMILPVYVMRDFKVNNVN